MTENRKLLKKNVRIRRTLNKPKENKSSANYLSYSLKTSLLHKTLPAFLDYLTKKIADDLYTMI